MNTKSLLTALAVAAVTLPLAQAQNEQVSREHRMGRAAPAGAILNRDVVTQSDKQIGQIEDVVFDVESGRILYLALDLKGAGINDTVAVPPALFTYGRGLEAARQAQRESTEGNKEGVRAQQRRHPYVVRTTEEALKGAPKYAKTAEDRGQAAYVDKIYAHFNQPRWWEGASGDSRAGKFNHIRHASAAKTFTVQNVSNEKLGQIETVLFDLPAGRVSYFILDPANSIANKQLLVPIPPMAFTRGTEGGKVLILDANKEKLNNAPGINRDELTAEDIQRLSNPAFATKVYNYYGKQPWFNNEGIPSPTGPDRQRNRERNRERNNDNNDN